MGRLAQTFAGLSILDMFPYNTPSEVTVAESTSGTAFPNADLLNTVDKPFAVHRLIPRIIGLDSAGKVVSPQPDLESREAIVRIRFELQGFNQNTTKAAVRIGNLLGGTTSERYWRFEEPFVLPNSYGVLAFVDVDAFPDGDDWADVTSLRVQLNLQGFLLQVAPPRG